MILTEAGTYEQLTTEHGISKIVPLSTQLIFVGKCLSRSPLQVAEMQEATHLQTKKRFN